MTMWPGKERDSCMRFMACLAFLIAAIDSAGWATGAVPQHVLADDHLWFWWIVAFIWGVHAVVIWIWRP